MVRPRDESQPQDSAVCQASPDQPASDQVVPNSASGVADVLSPGVGFVR